MQPESTSWPSAAEFPHDNPAFDRGALWTEAALCFGEPAVENVVAPEAPAELELVAECERVTALEPTAELERVAELELAAEATTTTYVAIEVLSPAATTTTSESDQPIDDPIATFVRAVTDVALAHGSAETAAHIESLFHFGTLDPESLSETAQAALFEGQILETTDDGVRTTASFASTRTAWESILRGESGDLSACGESTLDTWTADLVARLIASPDKAQTIRRDLRRRGIAAFGMLS